MGVGAAACAAALVAAGIARSGAAPEPPKPQTVSGHATGPFEVKLSALATPGDTAPEGMPGRMGIDKRYFGDLQGTGKGEMLTAMTSTSGSAGYVAIEHVSGSVAGRIGTFVLQHSGTMTRGAQALSITVVPDSGTGGLAGITGQMTVTIGEGGKHTYDFDYTLPAGLPALAP